MDKIKIISIGDACGMNKNQAIIPTGKIFEISKYHWELFENSIELTLNNKNFGWYSRIFFKPLAKHREDMIDEILKD